MAYNYLEKNAKSGKQILQEAVDTLFLKKSSQLKKKKSEQRKTTPSELCKNGTFECFKNPSIHFRIPIQEDETKA